MVVWLSPLVHPPFSSRRDEGTWNLRHKSKGHLYLALKLKSCLTFAVKPTLPFTFSHACRKTYPWFFLRLYKHSLSNWDFVAAKIKSSSPLSLPVTSCGNWCCNCTVTGSCCKLYPASPSCVGNLFPSAYIKTSHTRHDVCFRRDIFWNLIRVGSVKRKQI